MKCGTPKCSTPPPSRSSPSPSAPLTGCGGHLVFDWAVTNRHDETAAVIVDYVVLPRT